MNVIILEKSSNNRVARIYITIVEAQNYKNVVNYFSKGEKHRKICRNSLNDTLNVTSAWPIH